MFSGKEESSYKDKAIFLPAAGERYGTSFYLQGSDGKYWSSSLRPSTPANGRALGFDEEEAYTYSPYRCYGLPVRPVRTN